MRDLAIYGASGFGKEVACLVNAINKTLKEDDKWNLIGFFDDGVDVGTEISHFGKILGGINEVNNCDRLLNVVIAIASCENLKKNIIFYQ